MKEIIKRIEGIHQILEMKYKREKEHCANMQKQEGESIVSTKSKQLKAQLDSSAKLMKHLKSSSSSKRREVRKLKL